MFRGFRIVNKFTLSSSMIVLGSCLYYNFKYDSNTFKSYKIIERNVSENYLTLKIPNISDPNQKVPFYYAVKHPNIQVLRYYSPIVSEGGLSFFIKLYDRALMSEYLSHADFAEMKGPYYHPTASKIDLEDLILRNVPILCIAAGTGILPFYQILKKHPDANIKVLYCSSDNLLQDELSAFNVDYHHPRNPLTRYNFTVDQEYQLVLICGPERFTKDLCGYDNDEQYSLNNMYSQDHDIPVSLNSKVLKGWLKHFNFKDDQVIVL
eukprot:NODE_450_length_8384_cov_0.353530.p5 type:complete len:265 gc:universal NODE_450_length_8384_cov_0.353530:4742-5536(+)